MNQLNEGMKNIEILPETKNCIQLLNHKSISTGVTTGFNKPVMMNIREKLGLKPKATPQFGQSRSHAMNASKKMFKPNIQNKTVIIDGKKYKVKLTTREIRTLDKKGINLL